MTKTYILPTLVLAILIAAPAFAEYVPPTPAPLYFSAVNAGYKDNDSAHNADFIELTKTTPEPLPLADYHIRYFNSSDKQAGELAYDDTMYLDGDKLVLGYKNNPQFADAPAEYLYTFSSSGLASTGGRLQLLEGENVIDEICWGKVTCERQLPKFATDAEQNQTALRCEDECEAEFNYDKYYPEPDFEAITIVLPEEPEELEESSASVEEAAAPVSCKGLIFTELLSYSDDQFIELLNTSSETIDATGCQIRFKKKYYLLDAQIKPSAYYVVDDVPLTKNPSSSLTLELLDDNGTVDEISYAKGQKTGVAMALVDGKWLSTYKPTPGAKNVYQEFRDCPEGKVINPETGNCIKEATPTEPTPCPEGYDRNPETNRCRKIQQATKMDYPPEATVPTQEYDNPKIFIAVAGVIAAIVLVVGYVAFQFRREIHAFFSRLFGRKKRAKL